jgi:hypothetical protein
MVLLTTHLLDTMLGIMNTRITVEDGVEMLDSALRTASMYAYKVSLITLSITHIPQQLAQEIVIVGIPRRETNVSIGYRPITIRIEYKEHRTRPS